ncbi:sensor histidine kinase [Paenibacillus sp. TRM 82003]|nr:sensor histidine kinase [Paenibacillus sp. TRM 82003]
MMSRRWTWMDWLLFAIRCSWYATGLTYYYVYQERLGELSYPAFAIFVTLGWLAPLLFWRPGYRHPVRYAAAELIVSGGFSIYINNILGINLSSSVILLPILMIGYVLTKRMAFWAVPAFVLLLPANRYWTIGSDFQFYLQYADVLLFFGIGLGFNLMVRSQQRYKDLLAENTEQVELIRRQNQALEQYAAQVERLTLVQERNRMARDLHDSIGHHFTSVTVGLDAISYMVERDPGLAAEKIQRLADVAREGLAEVRRTIHQIAPGEEEPSLVRRLEALARDFEAHTGTATGFRFEGEEPMLLAHKQLALVRCLQECMTNAKRHGDAASIDVLLTFGGDAVVLETRNDGKTMDEAAYGFGLSAMKARLEELGGTLLVRNAASGGVAVTCTIPIGGSV